VFADGFEKNAAEVIRLFRPHAFDGAYRSDRRWSRSRHFAECCVMKDDIRRDAASARNLEPNRPQPIE
jgi:hypothetical protein